MGHSSVDAASPSQLSALLQYRAPRMPVSLTTVGPNSESLRSVSNGASATSGTGVYGAAVTAKMSAIEEEVGAGVAGREQDSGPRRRFVTAVGHVVTSRKQRATPSLAIGMVSPSGGSMLGVTFVQVAFQVGCSSPPAARVGRDSPCTVLQECP